MNDYDTMGFRQFTFKSELDKAMHTLEGIMKGVAIDDEVKIEEVEELKNWCDLHWRFRDVHPFTEIIPLLKNALADGILTPLERIDILWVCGKFKPGNTYYDIVTSDIQRLQGLLHGILSDNEINDREIVGLKEWLNNNEHLSTTYPYDEVYSLVLSVLKDKKIDEGEKKLLMVFFTEFIDTKASLNINQSEIDVLKKGMTIGGICSVCPRIEFEDKTFCFTGASSRSKRSEFAPVIESLGGLYNDNVTRSTDYLVIGNLGNPCWAFACYGRKVEKAMEMRKDGQLILIVHENDFWDAVADRQETSA